MTRWAEEVLDELRALSGSGIDSAAGFRLRTLINECQHYWQRRESAFFALLGALLSGQVEVAQGDERELLVRCLREGVSTTELEVLARTLTRSSGTTGRSTSSREPTEQQRPSDGRAAEAPAEGGETRALKQRIKQEAMDTSRRSREAAAMLETLVSRLELASELPELMRVDERLIEDIRFIAATQELVANRLDRTGESLDNITSVHEQLRDELQRMRTLSLTDEGTGLPNRRAFLRQTAAEIGRARREGRVLCLVLMDLDGFKSVNDRFGHAAGDEVLRYYASHVLSQFRSHDLVARYGGEEFAVLLPGTDIEGAIRTMDKVRCRVHGVSVEAGTERVAVPTFSAGIARYRAGESIEMLVERADKVLYCAKRNGRDRIEIETMAEYGSLESLSPLDPGLRK